MLHLLSTTCFVTAFTSPLLITKPKRIGTIFRTQLDATPVATLPTSIAQDRYEDLLQWFLSRNKDSYVSSKFEIRPSPCGGFGAFASEDMEAGELLLRIPRSCCVTLDDVFNDLDCGPALKRLMEQAGPGSDTVVIAGYLAKEYLLSEEYERRLREVEGGASVDGSARTRFESIKFGPYLRSLPWKVGVNSQDHVLFWEEDSVESLLKGSLAYDDAVEIRSSVKYATKILNGIVGPVVNKARGIDDAQQINAGFRLPWQPKKKSDSPVVVVGGLEEALVGAFVICLSRAYTRTFLGDYTKEEECLVPFLDILQHSNEPNVSHNNAEGLLNMIEVKASNAIKGGDELFNQYKAEEDANMPYHKFFTRFGFVPGVVEPMADLIAKRSTIFFPKQQVV